MNGPKAYCEEREMGDGIGWAVKQLIDGHKVRRAGWNGKDMWLCYVPGTKHVGLKEHSPYAVALGDPYTDIEAHVDIKTAQGHMQPGWVCSQADLLATDWELVT